MGIEIYCDGAAEPTNPGPGGWGFVVYRDGLEIAAHCGGQAHATNNQMEMIGMLRALEYVLAPENRGFATIKCDSQYVVKGCNDWRHRWKLHSWRKSKQGDFVKNKDIWILIDAALKNAPVKIEWVRGHVGTIGNERADALAAMGIGKPIEGISVGAV